MGILTGGYILSGSPRAAQALAGPQVALVPLSLRVTSTPLSVTDYTRQHGPQPVKIELPPAEIARICQTYRIREMGLFGSVARGEANLGNRAIHGYPRGGTLLSQLPSNQPLAIFLLHKTAAQTSFLQN